jgi:glycosyltransferase involved in cell wall biosynthesis
MLNLTEHKSEILNKSICVVNLYLVNHNQSGVTPDALSAGVPVLVTEKEVFCDLVEEYKAGIILNSSTLSVENIVQAILKIKENFDLFTTGAEKLYEDEFGFKAYKTYWTKILF